VLRARYFRDGQFLTASCPKAASYTWKSILHGRELLREGLVWRIGDRKSVDVWSDNWIPRAGLMRPLGHRPHTEISKVEEVLLDEGRGWDESKLREVFFDGDVDDIMKIPVGRAGTEDYLAWNYTKNRVFTVRSAYHLKMHINATRSGAASSSTNLDSHRGWLALWAAHVPGKAKIHAWRLVKNGLAVGEELQRRKIKPGVRCIVCDRGESLLHRFWACGHSAETWDIARRMTGMRLDHPLVVRRHRDLHGWLLEWFGGMKEDELSISIMILYQIWLARNEARDEVQIATPHEIIRKSLFLVEEW
jgi:hypothetical protein